VQAEEINRLWNDPRTGADLQRIGVETPQQLGALFVMDAEEIDRLTRGTAPLTDFYPKRLSDERWDEQASHQFARPYLEAESATRRFVSSELIKRIWPESLKNSIDFYFLVREARFLSDIVRAGNKWAELDLYVRHSQLRTPVLEVFGSDEFRLAMAEKVQRESNTPPPEIMPDLIAGALARRDVDGALRLLENKDARGTAERADLFLRTYLYCLNGSVEKAESLVADNAGLMKRDRSIDWLWTKLETDFGFHPPQ
jgi:hypothetical protein